MDIYDILQILIYIIGGIGLILFIIGTILRKK